MKKIWHKSKIFSPFVEGFAHAFDMFGVLSRKNDDVEHDGYAQDWESLEKDWQVICEDFRKIVDVYDEGEEK